MDYISQFLQQYQLETVITIGLLTASTLLYIIISHKKKVEVTVTPVSAAKSLFIDVNSNSTKTAQDGENDDMAEQIVVKKNIAFNTVYNLEEFMIRLYKLGFFVIRLKSDGTRKERFISIDQKGKLCFHKLAAIASNEQPKKHSKPYIRLPLSSLRECFACDDSPEPAFILDFKSKMLHLAVASFVDRDYIVKGIKLIRLRAQKNSTFLIRNSSLLEDSATPLAPRRRTENGNGEYEEGEGDGGEDDDDDRSLATMTTMNTSFVRR